MQSSKFVLNGQNDGNMSPLLILRDDYSAPFLCLQNSLIPVTR